jgi:hypothetical protein
MYIYIYINDCIHIHTFIYISVYEYIGVVGPSTLLWVKYIKKSIQSSISEEAAATNKLIKVYIYIYTYIYKYANVMI